MGPLCRLYGRFAAESTFVSSFGDLRLPDLPFAFLIWRPLIWRVNKLVVKSDYSHDLSHDGGPDRTPP